MTSQYRHRRTSNPATAFPTPLEPGEIAVNTANRQLAVGDAQSGVLGTPVPLLAIRIFDVRAQYAVGDMVAQGGTIYRAKVAVSPGTFNPAQWDYVTGSITAAPYVKLAGDVMTGMLTLPSTTPSVGTHATHKTYVDTAVATKASLRVGTAPPLGVNDGDLWFESDSGRLYVRYNDGTSTQWVIAPPTATVESIAAVSYAPQTLTDAEKIQARTNIAAAPFDALAYNGMQFNSSMEVNQEGNTANVINGSKYVVDGWNLSSVGPQNMASSQNPNGPPGFSYCVQLLASVANAAPAAGHYVFLQHVIEGYRVARLGWGTAYAQPITLGFWIFANRVIGNYSGVIMNGANNRSYPFTISISAAGGWEYKTITIPGCPDGTWAKGNTSGLSVIFTMMCGTTNQAPPNVWKAGLALGATGTVNGVAAVNDFILLTGLVVLPGIEAPSAARSPLIMRPFDQELMTCQRYYQKLVQLVSRSDVAGSHYEWVQSLVPLRASPTISLATTTYSNASGAGFAFPRIHGGELGFTATAANGYCVTDCIMDARL